MNRVRKMTSFILVFMMMFNIIMPNVAYAKNNINEPNGFSVLKKVRFENIKRLIVK